MGKTTTVKKTTAGKKIAGRRTAKRTTLSVRAVHGIAQLGPHKGGNSLSVPRFKSMVRTYRLGLPVWSSALHMSAATLEKRIEHNTAFHPLEADRLLTVEQVLERGMEVFEDAEDLADWLKEKHALLQNQRPIDLLGSTAGIGLVMMELGRIEHGVY